MRSSPRPPGTSDVPITPATSDGRAATRTRPGRTAMEWLAPLVVVLVAVVMWVPRQAGPIDLRWDGAGVLPSRHVTGRGERLQAAQRAGRDRGCAVSTTAAGGRCSPPAGARDERPDDGRPVASPVVVPHLRVVRPGRAVVPAIVLAARTRAARNTAFRLLPARLVPVRRVVPGGLVRRHHAAVPDFRARCRGPGARHRGLRVGARLIRAADGGHRGICGLGARQADQAPVSRGGHTRGAGASPCGRLARLCGVGRAERRVHPAHVRISAGTVPVL